MSEKIYLIMLAGLPGTGKSTVASKIVRGLNGYEVVSQNEIRRKFGIRRMPKTQEKTLRTIDRMTCDLLKAGKGVIFDSVNRFLFRRQQIYGIAAGCGANVVTLETVCSEREAKRRIGMRNKSDRLLSDPYRTEVYDRLQGEWEPIIEDYKHPGEDHVSYVVYDSEKNTFKRIKITKGMKGFLTRIEKILLEK